MKLKSDLLKRIKVLERENWYYRQYLDGKYGRLPDILKELEGLRRFHKENKGHTCL